MNAIYDLLYKMSSDNEFDSGIDGVEIPLT